MEKGVRTGGRTSGEVGLGILKVWTSGEVGLEILKVWTPGEVSIFLLTIKKTFGRSWTSRTKVLRGIK